MIFPTIDFFVCFDYIKPSSFTKGGTVITSENMSSHALWRFSHYGQTPEEILATAITYNDGNLKETAKQFELTDENFGKLCQEYGVPKVIDPSKTRNISERIAATLKANGNSLPLTSAALEMPISQLTELCQSLGINIQNMVDEAIDRRLKVLEAGVQQMLSKDFGVNEKKVEIADSSLTFHQRNDFELRQKIIKDFPQYGTTHREILETLLKRNFFLIAPVTRAIGLIPAKDQARVRRWCAEYGLRVATHEEYWAVMKRYPAFLAGAQKRSQDPVWQKNHVAAIQEVWFEKTKAKILNGHKEYGKTIEEIFEAVAVKHHRIASRVSKELKLAPKTTARLAESLGVKLLDAAESRKFRRENPDIYAKARTGAPKGPHFSKLKKLMRENKRYGSNVKEILLKALEANNLQPYTTSLVLGLSSRTFHTYCRYFGIDLDEINPTLAQFRGHMNEKRDKATIVESNVDRWVKWRAKQVKRIEREMSEIGHDFAEIVLKLRSQGQKAMKTILSERNIEP
jgi:uncharacterized protein (UPF0335 family)